MRLSVLSIILGIGLLLSPFIVQAQTWNLQVVDDAGDTGYDSQIVVTSDGTPYILYKNTSNYLLIAKWVPGGLDTGGWQYKQLDTGCPNGTPFEAIVDSQNHIHIAWGRTASPYAKYGIYDPATETWFLGPESITGGAYYCYIDLTLVTVGVDIIPCVTINTSGSTVSVYKRNVGGGWTGGVIDATHTASRAASIAVDSTQHMHVSFYEDTGQNLEYATKAWGDTIWQMSTVDITGNVGDYSSIAVTPDDHVHIVYYDTTNGDLKYATLTP